MKYAVFGSSGFLGRQLCLDIVESGHSLLGLDKKKPADFDLETGDCYFQYCDLIEIDVAGLTDLLRDIDIVFLLAAVSDLAEANVDIHRTMDLNFKSVVNVCDASIRAGVKVVGFASSIYASSTIAGFYSISKRASEDYIDFVSRRPACETKFVILRYGSIYGPGAPASNGVRKIVSKALETSILERRSEASPLREFVFVSDAARATRESCEMVMTSHADQRLFRYVITGQSQISYSDLVTIIAEILGFEVSANDGTLKTDIFDTHGHLHYRYTAARVEPNSLPRKFSLESPISLVDGLAITIRTIIEEEQ